MIVWGVTGQSGSGKSEMARSLRRELSRPFMVDEHPSMESDGDACTQGALDALLVASVDRLRDVENLIIVETRWSRLCNKLLVARRILQPRMVHILKSELLVTPGGVTSIRRFEE